MATLSVSRRHSASRVVGRTLLWIWLLAALFPLLFMVSTSIKPEGIARDIPPKWIFTPTIEHYTQLLQGGGGTSVTFSRLLFNSAAVTLGSTLLTLAVAVPAAYALAMRHFRARRALSSWILSTYMF